MLLRAVCALRAANVGATLLFSEAGGGCGHLLPPAVSPAVSNRKGQDACYMCAFLKRPFHPGALLNQGQKQLDQKALLQQCCFACCRVLFCFESPLHRENECFQGD